MIIDSDWLSRGTEKVAFELVGCNLCIQIAGKTQKHLITETEAYIGEDDLACHASKGRTPRTEVMYGPPGYWYVYLCYGIHHLLNIVTEKEGFPAAVLIRGIHSCSGPGRLTKALSINMEYNKKGAMQENGLWLETSTPLPSKCIHSYPRIGVDYAGPIWSKKPFRFIFEPTD